MYSERPSLSRGAVGYDTELMRHARVYSVADMFLMEGLKAKALVEFESKLTKFWLSESFLECVQNVYDTATPMPPGVKSAVVQTATKHLESLWQKKPFQDIVRENGDFAVDMIEEQVKSEGILHI
ncbi:hypothetical protein ACJ73_05589 [Blastomyces percursus]|uniref:Uncharacterized protein n=1 Tax=Blastomyces percursus TaxID=1658174 RepID=A0A1J9Q339_9EURO|nr:hypothetical protein ACJ73_05589 [Blastomyces percursus]